MLYFCSLIIAIVYFFIFLYIFRYKMRYFIKKIVFRIIPEALVLVYINSFMISILNSKIVSSLSKTQIYDVANQINNIFFHKFYYLTFFDFIVVILCIYFLNIIIRVIFKKGYIAKLKYLKTTSLYKYFNEIKAIVILFYIVYIILLYVSKEYFIYGLQHYIGLFTIFNIYFIVNMFLVMIELEFLLIPDLFKYKITKYDNGNFIKDENYMIYDYNMMFGEKKHLFIELCNYLKYYHREPLTICIDGKCGSGKSTFACVLQNELNNNYYVFNINGLIFTENNKLNDYFNFIIENLFKANGIYNSKLLKNYMNIINSVVGDNISNIVNCLMSDKMQKNYLDIKDEVNRCINKIFNDTSKKDSKKGIIFIIDDLERIYNESQIVNILIFAQYILGFDYIKFIFVTNLDILRKKLDNQYLDMFIHKIFKIDNTSINDILFKYFGELNIFKDNEYNGNLYDWGKSLSNLEFDKYIKEFGVYLYNNINLEYYIFTKKWIGYKSKLLEILKANSILDSKNNVVINFNNCGYEVLNEYYNYIYFKKPFLGENRKNIINNIYKLLKSNRMNLDLYNDEQIIAVWIYMEKNNLLDTNMSFDKNKYRVYKNLKAYKDNADKVMSLINLKLDDSPRNLKRQVSFFLYSYEKLDEYLYSIKDDKNFPYILEIVNQKDFVMFFIVLCFFRISNFINREDKYSGDSSTNGISILEIYKFLLSNYENLKSCSVQGIISFVYDNIDRIDIEQYISLKGFEKGVNYIYICFYIQTFIYKKLILEDINEDAFEILINFVDNLIKN